MQSDLEKEIRELKEEVRAFRKDKPIKKRKRKVSFFGRFVAGIFAGIVAFGVCIIFVPIITPYVFRGISQNDVEILSYVFGAIWATVAFFGQILRGNK